MEDYRLVLADHIVSLQRLMLFCQKTLQQNPETLDRENDCLQVEMSAVLVVLRAGLKNDNR
eukprot:6170912-Amphidinium_carterae.1